MNSSTASSRSYTMTARARSTEQTRARILDAAVALHGERAASEISLDHIAERASVSVQTVLRHFGSRDGLVEAAFAQAVDEIAAERRTPVGDVDAAISVLVEHYEARGDGVLVLLGQEASEPLAQRITTQGKQMHRAWVEEVFAPFVEHLDDTRAQEAIDLLVVVSDVYAWKLLRRDRGLPRGSTESRILRLVNAVLADLTPEKR